MAKATPRNYCKLDIMIWNHSGMRKLSPSAALTFIYLVAWSKCMKRDGSFDMFSVQQVGGSEKDVQALLEAEFVAQKDGETDSYIIPKFAEWQVTTSEEERQQEVARYNGTKGGRPKVDPADKDQREGWLKIAQSAWPPPGDPKFSEHPDNVRLAFYEHVKTPEDWEQFQAALMQKVDTWERRPESRNIKRAWLGSLQKFCTAWRDEILPTDEKPKKKEASAPKDKTKPFRVVVEGE